MLSSYFKNSIKIIINKYKIESGTLLSILWLIAGLYDAHFVNRFSRFDTITDQSTQLTNRDLPHGSCDLGIADCWLAGGDVTDDRDP